MSPSPSKISTSTSSGASSRAARASAVLNDSRLRLPERARIFTSSRLRRGEGRPERDIVGEEEAAARKRRVPLEPELGAVDRALELEADPLVAGEILAGSEEGALEGDRLRRALDR